MDNQALRALIESDQVCLNYLAEGNDEACAKRLIVLAPVEVHSYFLTSRGILAAFQNPLEGELVMQSLEQAAVTNPVVKRALAWLEPTNGGIDFGAASTRSMLDNLASAGVLTTSQVSVLKATAERPHIITHEQVAQAFGRGL